MTDPDLGVATRPPLSHLMRTIGYAPSKKTLKREFANIEARFAPDERD